MVRTPGPVSPFAALPESESSSVVVEGLDRPLLSENATDDAECLEDSKKGSLDRIRSTRIRSQRFTSVRSANFVSLQFMSLTPLCAESIRALTQCSLGFYGLLAYAKSSCSSSRLQAKALVSARLFELRAFLRHNLLLYLGKGQPGPAG